MPHGFGDTSWEIAPSSYAYLCRQACGRRQSRDRTNGFVIANARFGTTRGRVAGNGERAASIWTSDESPVRAGRTPAGLLSQLPIPRSTSQDAGRVESRVQIGGRVVRTTANAGSITPRTCESHGSSPVAITSPNAVHPTATQARTDHLVHEALSPDPSRARAQDVLMCVKS